MTPGNALQIFTTKFAPMVAPNNQPTKNVRTLLRHLEKVKLLRATVTYFAILVTALVCSGSVFANDFEAMKGSVVKIRSKPPDGVVQIGTGFVVSVDGDTAHIVTASHVVEGDPSPQVEFFFARGKRIKAEIGQREGDNDDRGLAYLIVRDKNIAAKGIKPLKMNLSRQLESGQEVFLMGFGEGQGDWAVIRATIVSMVGRDIRLDGRVDSGNSGSPIIQNGQVVGMVTQEKQGFGIGSPAVIVNLTLQGWGVKAAIASEITDAPNASQNKTKPDQPAANSSPSNLSSPAVIKLAGQYGGRSYSQAADGQQYQCEFAAVFTQTGTMANANFQNNCGDYGTIQGQIFGNSYRAKINSVSLGVCELAAEIQQGGSSLTGQFQCVGLAGGFSMSRQ